MLFGENLVSSKNMHISIRCGLKALHYFKLWILRYMLICTYGKCTSELDFCPSGKIYAKTNCFQVERNRPEDLLAISLKMKVLEGPTLY